jgi:hypothetical protein
MSYYPQQPRFLRLARKNTPTRPRTAAMPAIPHSESVEIELFYNKLLIYSR